MNEAQEIQTLLAMLRTGTDAQRRMAALKLGMMHNPLVIPDLLACVGDADGSVRALIASALAMIGEAAFAPIEAALAQSNAVERHTLVFALRHMPPPLVRQTLERLCQDPAPEVAAAAAETLRLHSDPHWRPKP